MKFALTVLIGLMILVGCGFTSEFVPSATTYQFDDNKAVVPKGEAKDYLDSVKQNWVGGEVYNFRRATGEDLIVVDSLTGESKGVIKTGPFMRMKVLGCYINGYQDGMLVGNTRMMVNGRVCVVLMTEDSLVGIMDVSVKDSDKGKWFHIDSRLTTQNLDSLVSAWEPSVSEKVRAGVISLGMTCEQVRLSWGPPSDVHRSVGSWGIREQWVYRTQYVYFENGIVTSYQD
ncbi:MAG: hypothetical protein ABII79_08600 [bacterium]